MTRSKPETHEKYMTSMERFIRQPVPTRPIVIVVILEFVGAAIVDWLTELTPWSAAVPPRWRIRKKLAFHLSFLNFLKSGLKAGYLVGSRSIGDRTVSIEKVTLLHFECNPCVSYREVRDWKRWQTLLRWYRESNVYTLIRKMHLWPKTKISSVVE